MNTTEPITQTEVPERLHPQKILVPMDFSDESKKALHYAASFARLFGSTLHLLHVVEPIPYLTGMEALPFRTPGEVELASNGQLAALARLEGGEEIPIEREIRHGVPYEEIVAAATACAADLVVIATHGRTGWEHAMLGSTAEKVVQHASCPVLVVRDHERECLG
jgi:nucleotide-binding universal stress UspA family protein